LLSTDLVHGVTQVLAALSLLAACKIGRGGGWTRARQRLTRPAAVGVRSARLARNRGAVFTRGASRQAQRRADRLRLALAALCVALLLSLLACAEVKGGTGLAEFEATSLGRVTE
jgi:hypothetical protein